MDGMPGDSAAGIERWLQKSGRWFIAYSVVFTIDLVTYAKTGIRMNLDTLPGLLAYSTLTWVTAAVLPFWQPDRARTAGVRATKTSCRKLERRTDR